MACGYRRKKKHIHRRPQRQHTHDETLNTRDIKERERKKKELFRINKYIYLKRGTTAMGHTHTYIPNKKVVILLNPNRKQIK